MDIAVVGVSAAGGVATFVVARNMLREHSSLSAPDVLAACVAVMAFFGLMTTGPVLVIGMAALGITCLVMPFVRFLFREGAFLPRQRSGQNPEVPRMTFPTARPATPPPSRRRTQPLRRSSSAPRPARMPGQPIMPLDIRHPAVTKKSRPGSSTKK